MNFITVILAMMLWNNPIVIIPVDGDGPIDQQPCQQQTLGGEETFDGTPADGGFNTKPGYSSGDLQPSCVPIPQWQPLEP